MLRFLAVFLGTASVLTFLAFGLGLLRWESPKPSPTAAVRMTPADTGGHSPPANTMPASTVTEYISGLPDHMAAPAGFDGFAVQPRPDADYLYVGAENVTFEVTNDALMIQIHALKLKKIEARARTAFSAIGVAAFPLAPELKGGQQFSSEGVTAGALDLMVDSERNSPISRTELDRNHDETVIQLRSVDLIAVNGLCERGCMVRVTVDVGAGPNGTMKEESRPFYLVTGDPRAAIPATPTPVYDWHYYAERAGKALGHKERAAAERNFLRAIRMARAEFSDSHPTVALLLLNYAKSSLKDKDGDVYLAAMTAVYDVYAENGVAAMRKVRLARGFNYDIEQVARDVGDFLWDERNYGESLTWYRRAYDAIPALELSPKAENRRYAYDAAGVMKTACVRKKYRETVAAMKDLKRRIGDTSARDQEYLQYWIRTGDPRIKDGRCGSDG